MIPNYPSWMNFDPLSDAWDIPFKVTWCCGLVFFTTYETEEFPHCSNLQIMFSCRKFVINWLCYIARLTFKYVGTTCDVITSLLFSECVKMSSSKAEEIVCLNWNAPPFKRALIVSIVNVRWNVRYETVPTSPFLRTGSRVFFKIINVWAFFCQLSDVIAAKCLEMQRKV